MISCAHVFYDPALPDFSDNCFAPNGQEIGKVEKWTWLSPIQDNIGDAAKVALHPSANIDALRIEGKPGYLTSAGNICSARGRMTYTVNSDSYQCSAPRFRGEPDPIKLEHRGVILHFSQCWLLRCDSGPVIDGHSGALLFTEIAAGIYQPIGIVCGYYANQAVVFDADRMFQRVGMYEY